MDLCESVLLGDYKDENPTLKPVETVKTPYFPVSPQNKPKETFLKPISPHDTPCENVLKSPLCYYSEHFRKHYEMAVYVPAESKQNLEGDFEKINNQPEDSLNIEGAKDYDKEKTLIKQIEFAEVLGKRINMSKIKLELVKPWIAEKVLEITKAEDNVVVEYIVNQLKQTDPDPRKMQINLTGFLGVEHARTFMKELWIVLESAQKNKNEIPQDLENTVEKVEHDTSRDTSFNLAVMREEENSESPNAAPRKISTQGEIDMDIGDNLTCDNKTEHNESVANNLYLPVTDIETIVKSGYPDSSCKNDGEPRRDFVFTNSPPECIAGATSTFGSHFTKGCKWSCDGTKLLTAADDNIMRIFSNMDSLDSKPNLKIKEGECVYDFTWLPGRDMFVSTGRYQPIHLWCGETGKLIGSYRCFDQYDELTHSFSVALNSSGEKLYAGLKNQIRIFDTSVPGRDCDVHVTSRKQELGQRGIISCLAVNGSLPVYAAGSYNRSVGLYSTTRGNLLCLLQGQTGGVTQVSFSQDGSKLYSGARKDSEIICWDLRQPGQILHTFNRRANSNQRIQFSLSSCGRYLVSGGTDGCVLVWDVARAGAGEGVLKPLAGYLLHPDCVNGVAFHPEQPLVATSAGQRHQGEVCSDSEEEGEDRSEVQRDCSVKIWRF